MRSSLALASEQDPQVLMATLLRVLCQYIRADYAAIALSDTDDVETFRLVASGSYDRITTRDLTLADEKAQTVCPATLMLKVARTNKVDYPSSRSIGITDSLPNSL
jgi:GAF domain-containing protein